jgi:hypothetical protein
LIFCFTGPRPPIPVPARFALSPAPLRRFLPMLIL